LNTPGTTYKEPIEHRARADETQTVQPSRDRARLLAGRQPPPDLGPVRLEYLAVLFLHRIELPPFAP